MLSGEKKNKKFNLHTDSLLHRERFDELEFLSIALTGRVKKVFCA